MATLKIDSSSWLRNILAILSDDIHSRQHDRGINQRLDQTVEENKLTENLMKRWKVAESLQLCPFL